MINKKILKLSSYVFAVIFSATAINVSAADKISAYQEKTDWCVAGEYPVTPENPEWESMSYTECLEACEMPEELLHDCSTEELSEYVLEYPFLCDIIIFDTAEQAIEHLSYTSNICREFFSREDSEKVMLEKYEFLNVDYKLLTDNSSENPLSESGYAKELFLQTFFAYNLQSLDLNDTESLKQILNDKYAAKKGICEDFLSSMLFYQLVQESLDYIPSNVVAENISDMFEPAAVYSGATGFVSSNKNVTFDNNVTYTMGTYMKYDRAPVCFRYSSGYYTDTELTAEDNSLSNVHKSWTRISPATRKYNCHSYAWITTDNSNRYWLNNPDYYANSKYFDCAGKNCSANAGDKIIIRRNYTINDGYSGSTSAWHSLIVTSHGAGVTSILTESKLGEYGVYRAPLYDMMVLYKGDYYNVYQSN